ncbi:MAG: four helix bundle protein [Bacteroidota bacterium]
MKPNNIILDKSYAFALKIVQLHMHLTKECNEYILSKQLLRSGTSIGANVEEAIGGISRKDFRAKMSIAYKEARETHYWLRLLIDSKVLTSELGSLIKNDCEEIRKILSSILKTLNS